MIFYKVKKEFDNKPLVFKNTEVESIYIANELFTRREVHKFGLNKAYLTRVNIPKKDTYFFFGARFN